MQVTLTPLGEDNLELITPLVERTKPIRERLLQRANTYKGVIGVATFRQICEEEVSEHLPGWEYLGCGYTRYVIGNEEGLVMKFERPTRPKWDCQVEATVYKIASRLGVERHLAPVYGAFDNYLIGQRVDWPIYSHTPSFRRVWRVRKLMLGLGIDIGDLHDGNHIGGVVVDYAQSDIDERMVEENTAKRLARRLAKEKVIHE